MDSHIKEYFTSKGKFHHVISLLDAPDSSWEEVSKKVPCLPKGWYELAQLSPRERILFLRDFWLSKIPFCPKLLEKLDQFFSKLDNIAIFIVQLKKGAPYHSELVYSLRNNSGFFRGGTPATDDQLSDLQKYFPETILPEDYMAFMRIHNGFSKGTDTGIIPTSRMSEVYRKFQDVLNNEDHPIIAEEGFLVNPASLIPFYESYGMPFYQCFWSEWYPENEMGNVYFYSAERAISRTKCKDPNAESLAFYTFSDWLFFYLETLF